MRKGILLVLVAVVLVILQPGCNSGNEKLEKLNLGTQISRLETAWATIKGAEQLIIGSKSDFESGLIGKDELKDKIDRAYGAAGNAFHNLGLSKFTPLERFSEDVKDVRLKDAIKELNEAGYQTSFLKTLTETALLHPESRRLITTPISVQLDQQGKLRYFMDGREVTKEAAFDYFEKRIDEQLELAYKSIEKVRHGKSE